MLTRARADSERSAARLAACGFEAVIAPVVAIQAVRSEPPEIAADAVIVTSAHAVPALAAHRAALEGLTVFAVGERTAAALRQAGFARVETAAGTGVELAALVAGRMAPGAALLHPAGRDRKDEPAASLRAAGFSLLPWTVYAAQAQAHLPEAAAQALAGGGVGFALHYSRRSLLVLLGLADRAGLAPALLALGHLCLSADVAAPLAGRGAARIRIAHRPDEDALVEALIELARDPGRTGSPAPHSR